MSDYCISVENLSKKYRLGQSRSSGDGLRHRLEQGVRSLFSSVATADNASRAKESNEFLALNDVSFQIKPGQVVGIIGRNGAGKSTLLKILSRITPPTNGQIRVRGRIASLLEVGTGFHPDLTGRENVFLNGAILGMTRVEITRKFDEIVAFAEIDKFIDTPVKRYSSGMYVRLAFAVAAHLDPEILIVDEVLAVGDVQFQQKCLGKMEDVASKKGRTVLFVSHNMGAVQALCQRGILLTRGTVEADTTATEAIRLYLQGLEKPIAHDLSSARERTGRGDVRLTGLEIRSGVDGLAGTLITGKPVRFIFHISELRPKLSVNFLFHDAKGTHVMILNSENRGPQDRLDSKLGKSLICDIERFPLLPGRYRLQVNVKIDHEQQDGLDPAAFVEVGEGFFEGRRETATPYGLVAVSHSWTVPN